ncbi:uncharacterized protein BT62DRAFT_638642 [Guyanagaster necrorhizus]|uniref:Uncharacterized protein n=1 Tax=Guyanagaster necrorhizus TaxID=856835 RepID=A0A9P7VHG3_9AGAR|nr:uncharacterized protein BT62DRAFT_638642 [Guyanagaster necrorhizus MCA 3950]KAG7440111.1 hypothetical protein BT62DRAFT_638642 [Guyanagaster necrorhizus MCA 3950]
MQGAMEMSRFHILSRDMSIVLDNHNSRDSNFMRVGIGSLYLRVWSSEAHPGMNRDRVRERVWLGDWRTTCGLSCAALGKKPVPRSASTKARWTRAMEPLGTCKAEKGKSSRTRPHLAATCPVCKGELGKGMQAGSDGMN